MLKTALWLSAVGGYTWFVPTLILEAALKVLIVDDHALFCDGLALLLTKLDCELDPYVAHTCAEAFSVLQRDPTIGLVLMDLHLQDESGTDGIRAIRAKYDALPIVAVSGASDRPTIEAAIASGAMGFIPKSYSGDRLFGVLQFILVHKGIFVPSELLLGSRPMAPPPALSNGRLV